MQVWFTIAKNMKEKVLNMPAHDVAVALDDINVNDNAKDMSFAGKNMLEFTLSECFPNQPLKAAEVRIALKDVERSRNLKKLQAKISAKDKSKRSRRSGGRSRVSIRDGDRKRPPPLQEKKTTRSVSSVSTKDQEWFHLRNEFTNSYNRYMDEATHLELLDFPELKLNLNQAKWRIQAINDANIKCPKGCHPFRNEILVYLDRIEEILKVHRCPTPPTPPRLENDRTDEVHETDCKLVDVSPTVVHDAKLSRSGLRPPLRRTKSKTKIVIPPLNMNPTNKVRADYERGLQRLRANPVPVRPSFGRSPRIQSSDVSGANSFVDPSTQWGSA